MLPFFAIKLIKFRFKKNNNLYILLVALKSTSVTKTLKKVIQRNLGTLGNMLKQKKMINLKKKYRVIEYFYNVSFEHTHKFTLILTLVNIHVIF